MKPRAVLVATQAACRFMASAAWPRCRTFVLVVGSDARANYGERNPLKRWWKTRAYRRATGIIAISSYTRQCLVDFGVPPDKVIVCHLGINEATWSAPRREAPALLRQSGYRAGRKMILSLCRLDPRKGLDIVLQALPRVAAEIPDVTYVAAGAGPDEARLRAIAEKVGVAERVIFLGRVSDEDAIGLYDACDVFVQPSRAEGRWVEGFGLTFLEAAARGKPCVAGRHGAVPEVVIDGETGLLVSPEDVEEVGSAVTALLSDARLAARLGEAARKRVFSEFTWERRAPAFAAALGLG
jgi:phosphatidylinositol alpha-1,6-mannosyltransferase